MRLSVIGGNSHGAFPTKYGRSGRYRQEEICGETPELIGFKSSSVEADINTRFVKLVKIIKCVITLELGGNY